MAAMIQWISSWVELNLLSIPSLSQVSDTMSFTSGTQLQTSSKPSYILVLQVWQLWYVRHVFIARLISPNLAGLSGANEDSMHQNLGLAVHQLAVHGTQGHGELTTIQPPTADKVCHKHEGNIPYTNVTLRLTHKQMPVFAASITVHVPHRAFLENMHALC